MFGIESKVSKFDRKFKVLLVTKLPAGEDKLHDKTSYQNSLLDSLRVNLWKYCHTWLTCLVWWCVVCHESQYCDKVGHRNCGNYNSMFCHGGLLFDTKHSYTKNVFICGMGVCRHDLVEISFSTLRNDGTLSYVLVYFTILLSKSTSEVHFAQLGRSLTQFYSSVPYIWHYYFPS